MPDLTRADFTLTEDGVPHDVATVQFVPPAEPMTLRWERTDGTPGVEPETITPPASPTWIYIATEVAPTEARRVEEAVRAFLLDGLRPGFKVSLGGRPFTDDQTTLLATLSHLARNPMGSNGQPGLVDLARPLADDAAEDRALASTFRRQEEGMAPLAGLHASGPNASRVGGSFAQPMITVGRAERSMPVYGDVALNQYFDLVERMAALPGKKSIVLMRPGLRLEPDNVGLLLDLVELCRSQARELLHRRLARTRVAVARRREVRAVHDRPAHPPHRAGPDRAARDGGAGARRAAEPCAGNRREDAHRHQQAERHLRPRRRRTPRATTSSATTRSTCARRAASAR